MKHQIIIELDSSKMPKMPSRQGLAALWATIYGCVLGVAEAFPISVTVKPHPSEEASETSALPESSLKEDSPDHGASAIVADVVDAWNEEGVD